jgi:ATP-binding cassette subfamily B protein RaxB
MKVILQTEASECALACLAMISCAHGYQVDLTGLRRRFLVSLKGSNLEQLMRYADSLSFSSRGLRLELEELDQLQLPCILHWDMNHFVVLKRVRGYRITILDPAIGERSLDLKEVSKHFTGVALELTPNAKFRQADKRKRIKMSDLTGRVLGLRLSLLQIFCVSIFLQLLGLLAPLLNQLIVDDVLGGHDQQLLPVLMVGFGLILLIQVGVTMARGWMVMILSQGLSLQWYSNVLSHMLRLPLSFFEKRHLGDLLNRFNSISVIQNTLTTNAVTVVLDALTGGVAVVMMFLYSPLLSLVSLGGTLAYALLRICFYRAYREAARMRLNVIARESSHFLETMRAMLPLKLFGREQERLARWQNLRVDVQNRDTQNTAMNIWFGAGNTLIFGLQNLAVFGLGAILILDSSSHTASGFTIGMFLAFNSFSTQFTSRAASLINYGVELHMLGLHSERLGDIALAEPERETVPENDLRHLTPRIELRDVSFRYGEGEPWVLKNTNLVVEAGERVAIVGSSGGGKTTLMKLMLGLLTPHHGEVLYGGVPIKKLGIGNFRRLIGTVMQEDVLLTGSIAENICFFDTRPDEARIRECAEMAAIDEEIMAMPMGFHTLVGDMGSSLSGGQKQRILLARALYKDPAILVLDEATSHLDTKNEKLVNEKLAATEVMRVFVAHRPETIASAERVFELRKGRLAERKRDKPASTDAMLSTAEHT